MITIQSFIKIDSITIFFDNEGIEEMINYLNFIKNNDASFHLSSGNELADIPFDEKFIVVPHLKMININKLDKIG